jgi:DNA polymerase III sliding clamp (beta) subunit (PCNA family)
MLLLPTNLASLVKMAGDDTRYSMSGISLSVLPDGRYRAEATNGRYLARVEGTPDSSDDYPVIPALVSAPNSATSALIPADDWTGAMKSAPKGRKIGARPVLGNVAVVMGEKTTALGTTDCASESVRQAINIEGRYPKTDDVFPAGEPAVTFDVDPKLLAELLTVAAGIACDSQHNRVTITVYSNRAPILVEAQNASKAQTFRGLVMPLT